MFLYVLQIKSLVFTCKNQLMLGFDKHHFCILPKKDQGIITFIKHKGCKNYPLKIGQKIP